MNGFKEYGIDQSDIQQVEAGARIENLRKKVHIYRDVLKIFIVAFTINGFVVSMLNESRAHAISVFAKLAENATFYEFVIGSLWALTPFILLCVLLVAGLTYFLFGQIYSIGDLFLKVIITIPMVFCVLYNRYLVTICILIVLWKVAAYIPRIYIKWSIKKGLVQSVGARIVEIRNIDGEVIWKANEGRIRKQDAQWVLKDNSTNHENEANNKQGDE